MNISTATARIHGLDTLRALAIVLVFMSHYASFVSGEPTFGFLGEVGWSGVDLFFALSGYLIGNQILAALRGPERLSLGRFYARRLLRTLPNFYVVLALYACWPYFRGASVMPELWRFLSFTQNLGLNPGTAFSHAWSLCVEEQFYMLLPALALLIAARRRALPLAWLLVFGSLLAGMLIRSYVWHNYIDGNERDIYRYYNLVYYSTLCRFDELVAGVALALVKNHHAALWQRLTAYGNWMLAAGAALLGLAWYLFLLDRYGYAATVFGYPLLAVAISLLLLAALSPGALLHRLRVPGAAALALWSYAIYLSHKQLCVLLGKVLAAQGLAPTGWPAVSLLSLASVAAGWLLYSLVERPFMVLRQRWVPHHFVREQGDGSRPARRGWSSLWSSPSSPSSR
ncbi:acyltransferase family protein [Rugamonas sp. CCM 8940]|uniref:acyltransferase family protein n=1 Tax=Rugamonas sp. CCM 8940 TaxID=2765359 RepID=UPI0018F2F98B|nr:acyltransferase [Rugamonas sp. CCM 8940]MBJ7311651.1 acyltransferase [Rugamonas sp. CCM 8940]